MSRGHDRMGEDLRTLVAEGVTASLSARFLVRWPAALGRRKAVASTAAFLTSAGG